jgi:hypothetical protein
LAADITGQTTAAPDFSGMYAAEQEARALAFEQERADWEAQQEQRAQWWDERIANGQATAEQANADMEIIMQTHEQNMIGIASDSAAAQAAIKRTEEQTKQALVKKAWADAESLMDSKSRKMFEIGKAAAIANNVVNTIESVSSAYSDLPWPVNIPASIAAAAAGAVRHQQLSAAKFGGGGGASSGSTVSIGSGPDISKEVKKSDPVQQYQTTETIRGSQSETTINGPGFSNSKQVAITVNIENMQGGGDAADLEQRFERVALKVVEENVVPVLTTYYDRDGVTHTRRSAQYQELAG